MKIENKQHLWWLSADHGIAQEQVNLLFKHASNANYTVIIGALFILYALSNTPDYIFLLAWCVAICVLAVFRIILAKKKHYLSEWISSEHRVRWYLLFTFLIGCLWSLLPFLFVHNGISIAALIVVIFMIATSGIIILSSVLIITPSYILPPLGTLAYTYYYQGDSIGQYIAIALVFIAIPLFLRSAMTYNSYILSTLNLAAHLKQSLKIEQQHKATLEQQNKAIKEQSLILEQTRKKAEYANQAKSHFLSHMSHELRTPLNAILGFSQLLELDKEELSTTQQDNVQEILNASRHLLQLINEILDLSKIEAGKLEIFKEKVYVNDILQSCIQLIAPQMNERKITLTDNISHQELSVFTDPHRFKQILINLLSNAVKYNREQGSIILDAEAVDGNGLQVLVTDTGNGLSEEDIKKLFVSFERLKNFNHVDGTGIGLVLSKNLIALMGGTIGVNSTPGKGSTFWIILK